ncbi:hypothetical protein [Lacticaseibacillus manihotivorans]|uniref:hypothetical protein n=1 Tax=Lacticaseibacillus manihotivorans TaxID=88233 RepID=UPI0006D1847C|nr:hypothetical protein [Lacticaseibacillus manihotivorans]
MKRLAMFLLLFCGLAGAFSQPVHAASKTKPPVTLYLHGAHGTKRSMTPLVKAAQWDTNASVITAKVNHSGR